MRAPRTPRLRSLRARLLLAALALVVAALAVADTVSILALRATLLQTVDRQLAGVPGARPPGAPAPASPAPPAPGTPATAPGGGNADSFLSNLVVTLLDGSTGAQRSVLVGPLQAGAPRPDLTGVARDIRAGTVREGLTTVGGSATRGTRTGSGSSASVRTASSWSPPRSAASGTRSPTWR